MWNPSTCDCGCNKAYKITKYLDIKNCSCKNLLLGKLVLGRQNEISNTTGISLIDQKLTPVYVPDEIKKNQCKSI